MHLPAPSPPIRGRLLVLLSRLTAIPFIRDLVVARVRKDAGISSLPEAP